MNRLPGTAGSARHLAVRLAWLAAVLVVCSGCRVAASDADGAGESQSYRLDYRVTLDPAAGGARVEMRLRQSDHLLREVDMPTLGGRLEGFEGDGELSADETRVRWLPPAGGGTLRWFARLDHRRGGRGYDAYIEADWALFRFEDLIPSAGTRSLRGSRSDTRVEFDLPRGWSIVTPYREEDGVRRIDNPKRRFDTPTGWIVAGDIGVRIDTIEGVRVIVAGPVGHTVRRMDILALLHWSLPTLARVFPGMPDRLTIVSAGDPMWRGALSAPQSLYVHADRPLLSGNATSTLLHEVVHVGLGLTGNEGADWIIEGLAEYYSLEVLRRSGTITGERFRDAHRHLASWSRDADDLCRHPSTGSTTALAVTVLRAVDAEIRKVTSGGASLDDVVRALPRGGRISVRTFRDIATKTAGAPLEALEDGRLKGCRDVV